MAKRYIKGSAKEHIFENGGSNIHIDILKADFNSLPTEVFENKITKEKKEYVKLTVSKLKEPDQYGNTHTVFLNDWKPTGKAGGSPRTILGGITAQASAKAPLKAKEQDDFPF